MASQWDNWLRELRAAGKGGQAWPKLGIDRGREWTRVLAFEADYSADAFACNLAVAPDGTTLVSPTVVVGAFGSGVTPVTISLTAVQTANLALIPADGDVDGVEELCFDLLRTPFGGAQDRLMAGVIPVRGKV